MATIAGSSGPGSTARDRGGLARVGHYDRDPELPGYASALARRYMNAILGVDPGRRQARVQPGMICALKERHAGGENPA